MPPIAISSTRFHISNERYSAFWKLALKVWGFQGTHAVSIKVTDMQVLKPPWGQHESYLSVWSARIYMGTLAKLNICVLVRLIMFKDGNLYFVFKVAFPSVGHLFNLVIKNCASKRLACVRLWLFTNVLAQNRSLAFDYNLLLLSICTWYVGKGACTAKLTGRGSRAFRVGSSSAYSAWITTHWLTSLARQKWVTHI